MRESGLDHLHTVTKGPHPHLTLGHAKFTAHPSVPFLPRFKHPHLLLLLTLALCATSFAVKRTVRALQRCRALWSLQHQVDEDFLQSFQLRVLVV